MKKFLKKNVKDFLENREKFERIAKVIPERSVGKIPRVFYVRTLWWISNTQTPSTILNRFCEIIFGGFLGQLVGEIVDKFWRNFCENGWKKYYKRLCERTPGGILIEWS